MRITILGTGTSAMMRGRVCSAYHVRTAGGGIGIDMGSGVLSRYCDAGIDFMELDALVLTHTLHPDHVSDVPMMFFSMNYNLGRRRDRVLPLFLPRGGRSFIEGMFALFPKARPRTYELLVQEVADEEITVGTLTLRFQLVDHAEVPTIGVRIGDGTKAVAFTSDTRPCEGVVALLKDVDIGVVHCAVAEGYIDSRSHSTARDVGRFARTAAVTRLVCTHRYPVGTTGEVMQQIRESFQGEVVFAEDFDQFVL